MADYIVPTADDIFTRFTALDSTKEETVTLMIAEAVDQVSTGWRAKDYTLAIMLLVAHWLTNESGDTVDRPGVISSESFGPMSRSFSSGGSGRSITDMDGTEYGRRFVSLRRKNFPGPLVAGTL